VQALINGDMSTELIIGSNMEPAERNQEENNET